MADPPGLVRRGNVWMIRVRVPERVKPIIKKQEITKSLRTTSHREARLRAWDELRAVAHCFEQAEIALGLAETRPHFPHSSAMLNEGQIREAVSRFLGELEAGQPQIPFDADAQRDLQHLADDEAYHYSRTYAVEDAGLQGMASAFAERLGIGFPDGKAFIQFCDGIREALSEHSLRRSALLRGAPVATVNPAFSGVGAGTGEQIDSLTLGAAISSYMNAPSRAGNSASTKKMDQSRLGALRDIVGPRRPVRSITRADMRAYLEQLIKLPANAGQRFKGMAPMEAIAAGEKRGAPTLSAKSIKLYCDAARSFFAWLEMEEMIDRNVARQLSGRRVEEKSSRRPYLPGEMQALVDATPRVGGQAGEWAYWCARIAILQGLRLTEPLGFLVSDIAKRGDIWVWCLRPNEYRTLKTSGTIREVPIHPKLIELGILQLVEGRAPEDLLLPGVPVGKGKSFGAAQKQMSRIIRKHVSDDPNLVFHSLRHSFRDETRNCGMPRELVEQIGGWASGSKSAMDGYGQGYSLSDLRDWLSKVTFNGVVIE